jgi:hypothetical protein
MCDSIEPQAIQLVCTSVKGPELAVALKGVFDSIAAQTGIGGGKDGEGEAAAARAGAFGASLALLSIPPGALAASPEGAPLSTFKGACRGAAVCRARGMT